LLRRLRTDLRDRAVTAILPAWSRHPRKRAGRRFLSAGPQYCRSGKGSARKSSLFPCRALGVVLTHALTPLIIYGQLGRFYETAGRVKYFLLVSASLRSIGVSRFHLELLFALG
jgi:hypothetical protein